jgi:hypothetical protein
MSKHRLHNNGHTGTHRTSELSRIEKAIGAAIEHFWHGVVVTGVGLPSILAFESLRPIWEGFVHMFLKH